MKINNSSSTRCFYSIFQHFGGEWKLCKTSEIYFPWNRRLLRENVRRWCRLPFGAINGLCIPVCRVFACVCVDCSCCYPCAMCMCVVVMVLRVGLYCTMYMSMWYLWPAVYAAVRLYCACAWHATATVNNNSMQQWSYTICESVREACQRAACWMQKHTKVGQPWCRGGTIYMYSLFDDNERLVHRWFIDGISGWAPQSAVSETILPSAQSTCQWRKLMCSLKISWPLLSRKGELESVFQFRIRSGRYAALCYYSFKIFVSRYSWSKTGHWRLSAPVWHIH